MTPVVTPGDAQAGREGWKRADRARTIRLQHWEYDAEGIGGLDYDVGAVLVRSASVVGEGELAATLEAWGLHAGRFRYPWETDDPR
ncbi:hypothetical protein FXF68_39410 [Actinomadura decatromicini]|uniref:Uncharacterized protein n=1 Tax=Actinomadura decatromicini TaxID=2604572 RepID=A0A5D3F7M5_9ACTN|nr:hypothetical protein FXF68_39410 [Actinomadura decatromicini]